jgi:hypothetical protein
MVALQLTVSMLPKSALNVQIESCTYWRDMQYMQSPAVLAIYERLDPSTSGGN